MPSGIVSLLDHRHYRQVVRIWERLRDRFELTGVMATPYPHFSYHVAHEYDRPRIESVLEQIGGETSAFSVATVGLATFSGAFPVVYVRVVPTPRLDALQRWIYRAAAPAARGVDPHYAPANWIPHITVAHGDRATHRPLDPPTVDEILRELAREEFRWRVRVDNLTLIVDDGERQRLGRREALREAEPE